MFKQVTIMGPGLLGASLVLAVKKKLLAEKIVVWARSENTAKNALEKLPVDQVERNPSVSVRGSQLVVLCTPVETITSILNSIIDDLDESCIVTDVGSVKSEICKNAENLFKKSKSSFIGSHPMAGSEKAGMDHANENLFSSRTCIITPNDKPDSEQLKKLTLFWEYLGMKSILMNPQEHDAKLSQLSHLPHLVSSVLAHSLHDKIDEAPMLCGQGLRDTVRIAGGSPELWAGIIEQNKINILESVEKFEESLQTIRNLISHNDFNGLQEFLKQGSVFQNNLNK